LEFARTVRHERSCLVHTLDFRALVSIEARSDNDLVFQDKVLNGFYILQMCRNLVNVQFLVMDGIVNWELPPVYHDDDDEVTDPFSEPGPWNVNTFAWFPVADRRLLLQPSSSGDPDFKYCPIGMFSWSSFDKPTLTLDRLQPHLSMSPYCYRHSRCSILPSAFSLRGCGEIDGMRVVCFPAFSYKDLTFLDLSYTSTSESWIRTFSDLSFPNLRVLKLRGLRLTDISVPKFLLHTRHKVWSLDLRDNLLTDSTISSLGQNSSHRIPSQPHEVTYAVYQPAPRYFRNSDPSQDRVDEMALRSDTTDAYIKQMATNPSLSGMNQAEPLLRDTGLTHLYLSGNKFTCLAFVWLLQKLNSLQVLDVGNIRGKGEIPQAPHKFLWDTGGAARSFYVSNSPRLSFLRIHHSIITCMPTISDPTTSLILTSYAADHLATAERIGAFGIQGQCETFTPLDNSAIETLTLTGIPTKSTGHLIKHLLEFLVACREQEDILNRARENTKRRSPPVYPGLKTLKLEFVPPSRDPASSSAGTASVSGERDADEFAERSWNDFSFFRSAELEPTNRPGPGLAPDEKMQDVAEVLRKARDGGENKWSGKLELVFPWIRR
jgi:hypothetical protein